MDHHNHNCKAFNHHHQQLPLTINRPPCPSLNPSYPTQISITSYFYHSSSSFFTPLCCLCVLVFIFILHCPASVHHRPPVIVFSRSLPATVQIHSSSPAAPPFGSIVHNWSRRRSNPSNLFQSSLLFTECRRQPLSQEASDETPFAPRSTERKSFTLCSSSLVRPRSLPPCHSSSGAVSY
ncbi:thiol:disulfide interchange protein DsbA/DsbL [Sesbania bispinosa]|nr:thiol:disulfide interchange protein DsbA/DsbL [Sesbania bispinosa]